MQRSGFIPAHGSYRNLLSYRKAEVVFDLTVRFCARFVSWRDRTYDQMVQAARSGKQNIAEGSLASAISSETEIRLTNVARSSLEELLLDFEDFLRVRGLRRWRKDSAEAQYVRKISRTSEFAYDAIQTICETRPAEVLANIAICLIHQTNYLLDHQLRRLEADFLKNGDVRERMKKARMAQRKRPPSR